MSSEREAFDSVFPTGTSPARPRSQGARRRALPPDEVLSVAFGASAMPSKKKKKTTMHKLAPSNGRREPSLFPALTARAGADQRPVAVKPSSPWPNSGTYSSKPSAALSDNRVEEGVCQTSLRQRLHASGGRRSHAQTTVSRAASPTSNQFEDASLNQTKRSMVAKMLDSHMPLVPPNALHPSSSGVLVPTRPLTSSSIVRPATRVPQLQQFDSTASDTPRLPKKVPLTARDRFYLEQRAMTAPSKSVRQSPRSRIAAPPAARTPESELPKRNQSGGHVRAIQVSDAQPKPAKESPRRTEMLSRCDEFKTLTETIEEDLRCNASLAAHSSISAHESRGVTREAIQVPVAPSSFVYLSRVDSNPYHLTVTNHSGINPDNYYTASRLGITHFAHNSSEFVALEKFEREHYIYSLIVKIPFFRKYRLWKRFTLWKQEVNDRKRTVATLSLNRNLFVLLPHLREALMQLRALCVTVHRIRLFDFGEASAIHERSLSAMNSPQQSKMYTLGEFSIRLKAQKMECERLVDQFVAKAVMIAKNACEEYLYAFLEVTGFNEDVKPTSLRNAKPRYSFAVPDAKPTTKPRSAAEALQREHEMTYTERATMRTQCRKITKFLRVVEYLVLDALLRVAISSTEALVQEMKNIKDGQPPVSTSANSISASQAAVNAAILSRYRHSPLFRVEVSLRGAPSGPIASPPMHNSTPGQLAPRPQLLRRLSSSSLLSLARPQPPLRQPSESPSSDDHPLELVLFKPHEEQLRSQLETLVFNGLKAVTSRDRLLSNSMFKVYLDAGMDEGVGGDDGDDDDEKNSDFVAEGLDLDMLIMEDASFTCAMQALNVIVQEAFRRADDTCTSFAPFLVKFQANAAFCGRVVIPSFVYAVEVDELRDLLEHYTSEIRQFDALPESSSCGLLLLDNAKLNGQLKPSPRKCLEQLHLLVPAVIRLKNVRMMDDLTGHNDKISAIPASVDEYAETLVFLRYLQSQMETIEDDYSTLKGLYQLVEEYHIKISDTDQTNAFMITQRRAQLKTSMELFDNSCEQYTEKFGVELEARVPGLVRQLAQVQDALTHPKLFQLESDPQDVVEYIDGVEVILRELEASVERHSFLESALSIPHTTAFEELAVIKQDLHIKAELWNGMRIWNVMTKEWRVLRFPGEVDVLAITDEITAIYSRILQWEAQLPPGTGLLCASLKSRVDDYRITMPILRDLGCPSFEERHYKELHSILGFEISPLTPMEVKARPASSISEHVPVASQSLTIGQLIEMKIGPFAQQVNRVANDAAQERLLKESLYKIIAVWEQTEFEVRAYKDSKDYAVVTSYELIYATLDESLVNLTALLSSKYLSPIKETATIWQRRLACFQEILDAWVECQRKWIHLETIFSAPDIQKQLPNESMMFATVNQFWKDLMRKAREHRNCMKVCGAIPHTGGTVANLLGYSSASGGQHPLAPAPSSNPHANQIALLENLNRHNASLDKIEKSLEDYLETKRGFFPRFFFISNDELLEMLAHAKEPQSVQRHLCKCFDALIRLDLREDGVAAGSAVGDSVATTTASSAPDILAMVSPEGERVAFTRTVKARGNVEDWLNAVLSNMRVTLQRHMKASVFDYQHASRETWLFRHPAQCVAVVSYVMWARECEACFLSSSNDPLNELSTWHQTICTQLSNLTRFVRTSLSSVQRCLIVSLITTDVHFRDVVEDLISKQVTSAKDFIWVQQLRYYWHAEQDECVAQQANCRIHYGYEYMGACSRLVITPLTDRCWMTITGALTLSFGAAPSGPAGTGKTETSKDLAKALGTLCIVFNCSDQIDYKMMAKIFNGAVQSGAWACLDEFNRIDIEVLSVVAQQMTTIRHARLGGSNDVMFEGKLIPLREHHIIITMNPGYAGRTELPDNLKVCFRPVAMMVPDYALIVEILLFAEGFQQAKSLSKKMTKLYKLCSEQLSQQPHYDFGMRAVKSVLLIAGGLKRAQGGSTKDESLTLIKAMEDANIPKLIEDDVVLFHGLLRDLFPDELAVREDDISTQHSQEPGGGRAVGDALMGEIDRQISLHGLVGVLKWKQKIAQLFETLAVRVGVVQTGRSGSGKSTAFKMLKGTLTALRETQKHADKRFQKVVSFVLNPKSIGMNELYGFFHPITREWTDGLASRILRQCISEKSAFTAAKSATDPGSEGGPFYWVTFDGPIDVLWIESMNTVLDDNMTLCLANGERIKLLHKIQLLFEVSDTASASPATVSRLGVVYYHPSYLGWQPIVQSWLNALSIPASVMSSHGLSHSPSKDSTVQSAALLSNSATAHLSQRLKARIIQCFDIMVEPGLAFIRSANRAAVLTSDISYIASLCCLFETVLLHRGVPETFAALNSQSQASSNATTASAAAATAVLEKQQNRCIDLTFLFSFVWSFGGNLLLDHCKAQFQEFVHKLVESNEQFFTTDLLSVNGKVPTRMSQVNDRMFDFYVDFQLTSFAPWDCLTLPSPGIGGQFAQSAQNPPLPMEFNPATPLFQLIVPTMDMVKYSYITKLIALDGMSPVYLTGVTGSGKSVLVNHLLRTGGGGSNKPQDLLCKRILPIIINFSAQTSSLVTQLTIESKLSKVRKNLLGPPANTKAVVFVDDVNMPTAEVYGAQPPIELLRQFLEYRGLYDREKFFWKEISDTVLVAAGGLQGGSRPALCPRFVRQFSVILCLPGSDESSMNTIFSSILSAHFAVVGSAAGGALGGLSRSVKDTLTSIVDATVLLYQAVSQTLLPTPSKAYYLFNLRDITKLMQGFLIGAKRFDSSQGVPSLELLSRLWAHECIRVFRDRLMEEPDKRWFSEQLITLANRHLGLSWTLEHVFKPAEHSMAHRLSAVGNVGPKASVSSTLLFVPSILASDVDGVSAVAYEQVSDLVEFEERLDHVNESRSDGQHPQLVFFKEAMFHVGAIARILIQPRGHALLLGIAGSGKRSLARIACLLLDYCCQEIELTKNYGLADFREALKTAIISCVLGERSNQDGSRGGRSLGTANSVRPVVFLLSESQLISEHFVEDINTILNGGEIPRLFALDEYEKLLSDVRSLLTMNPMLHSNGTMKEFSRSDCETHFRTQVQQAMHIIVCHSPLGNTFRTRMRQFPSLINCMTIDYFEAWPRYALQYVADRFLMGGGQHQPSVDLPTATRQAIAMVSMEAHQSILSLTSDFVATYQRHVHFTPKHFIDLIRMFRHVYREKQAVLEAKLTRLSVGVIKLEETNALVATLQDELVALQPILQSKTIEADQLLHQVGIDQREAGLVAARVAQDETSVKQQQREVAMCQNDAQQDLDQALPALNAAVQALDSLDKRDITEVKAFIKPPLAVQVVMEAVCIMLGEKADWDTSKRVLSRTTFMSELKEYDKDTIHPAILKKIRKYIENPDFAVDEVRKVSRAALSLCMWVHAIDSYARIYKDVAPKRQRLAEMNGVLAEANAKLAAKQQELELVMTKVQTLKDQCDKTLAEKKRLILESELTQARLQRAERLTVGLKDERVRWKASIEQLRTDGKAVLGDAFLTAAAMSYLGPFNGNFRLRIMRQWVAIAAKLVDLSPSFSVVESSGDAMELREWELLGLPSDTTSKENAIFVMKGNQQRWPLLIDPQQQATQWIQRLEAAHGVATVKAQDRDLLQVVEKALDVGTPLIIQNLSEAAMEHALEPLLLKAYLPATTKGGTALIKLGDRLVRADSARFRLYLVTQMPNPHFAPDVFIRTNVINFTVTTEGLTEQLLGDVVRRERVDVEERKHSLLYSITQDQKMLHQNEIKILNLLSESKGNILDDVELIQALETAKHTSRVVTLRLQESEVSKQQLLEVRNQYHSVAVRGALLFFVVADLAAIDSMYQYSLEYFRRLFTMSLVDAPASTNLDERLQLLQSHLVLVVFRNIARGLFEVHKLLFSALICLRLQLLDGEISHSELELLDGLAISSTSGEGGERNGTADVVVDPMETLATLASRSLAFENVLEIYRSEPTAWMEWTTANDPYVVALPGDCDQLLTAFQRLLLIRWMRDDAWIAALRHYVEEALGDAQFVGTSSEADSKSAMTEIFKDMDKTTPCIFILSSGADPTTLLSQFARDCPGVYPDRYRNISLGQGQGPIAERLLESCAADGDWLVLQNIHLAKSWIPQLEQVLSVMCKTDKRLDVHPDFRLFLTVFPVEFFPISILQNAVKVTNEPPKGIKANLQRSLSLLEGNSTFDPTDTSTDNETARWLSWLELQLIFGLSFFHAVIQERAKFGSLGWNLKYDFSNADFLSVVTLQRHLLMAVRDEQTLATTARTSPRTRGNNRAFYDGDEAGTLGDEDGGDRDDERLDAHDIPWDALHFLTGEIYYGGRITDEFDRRCLMANLHRFSSATTVSTGPVIDRSGLPGCKRPSLVGPQLQLFASMVSDSFHTPSFSHRDEMVAFVNVLPSSVDAPFVFGMHPNANVFYLKQETQRLVAHIVQLQSGQPEGDGTAAKEEEQEEGQAHSARKLRRTGSVCDVATREALALYEIKEIERTLPRVVSASKSEAHESASGCGGGLPDPFTVVLNQELAKCNALLRAVHAGLDNLERALQGLGTMSPQLEEIQQSLWHHHVPLDWRKRDGASVVTATSTQSLALWVNQIRFRTDFLQQWAQLGHAPNNGIFPLSVFCFPQGFFTAILQRHARKYSVPIHQLEFQFMVLRESFLVARKHQLKRGYSTVIHSTAEMEMLAETARAASVASQDATAAESRRTSTHPTAVAPSTAVDSMLMDGAFVSGLFLEGAQWSDDLQCLVDPRPGVLHHAMPVIHVVPQVASPDPTGREAIAPRLSSVSRTKAMTPSYLTLRSPSALLGTPTPSSPKKASLRPEPHHTRPSISAARAPSIVAPTLLRTIEYKYVCPLYKTRARKGTLSTTGASTNFVLAMELACEKPPDHYTLNGTALISNLSM